MYLRNKVCTEGLTYLLRYYKRVRPSVQTKIKVIEVKKDYEQVIDWLVEILDRGREKGFFKFGGEASVKASITMNNLISGVIVARVNQFEKTNFRKTLNRVLGTAQY